MPSAKPRARSVDEYIAAAPECTRPILEKLRRIFRRASPRLKEEIKWGVPCFTHEGPVGGMAAYTRHVSWGLWKSRLLKDPGGLLNSSGIVMGGRIASVAEVPPAAKLIALIRQVIALNEAGVKNPEPRDPEVPADLAAALKRAGKAAANYAAFTPARKWQYVNWVTQAKRPETRANRIATAVERIREGKTMK